MAVVAVENTVPDVGKVTLVDPVVVRVKALFPEVVKLFAKDELLDKKLLTLLIEHRHLAPHVAAIMEALSKSLTHKNKLAILTDLYQHRSRLHQLSDIVKGKKSLSEAEFYKLMKEEKYAEDWHRLYVPEAKSDFTLLEFSLWSSAHPQRDHKQDEKKNFKPEPHSSSAAPSKKK